MRHATVLSCLLASVLSLPAFAEEVAPSAVAPEAAQDKVLDTADNRTISIPQSWTFGRWGKANFAAEFHAGPNETEYYCDFVVGELKDDLQNKDAAFWADFLNRDRLASFCGGTDGKLRASDLTTAGGVTALYCSYDFAGAKDPEHPKPFEMRMNWLIPLDVHVVTLICKANAPDAVTLAKDVPAFTAAVTRIKDSFRK